eukprot:266117_1
MIQNTVLSLFALYELSSSSRLLLQQPEQIPSNIPSLPHIPPPPGYGLGAFGQVCPDTEITQCNATGTTNTVSDINGTLICNKRAECCSCNSIQCGYGSHKCESVLFGHQAAFGVQEIIIDGWRNGTVLDCNGLRSCQMTTIYATNVMSVNCAGNRACHHAHIIINDPVAPFTLNCGGLASCAGLKLEINFSAPPIGFECRHITDPTLEKEVFQIAGIECDAGDACNTAQITINNDWGCDTVHVENIECTQRNACDDAMFNLIGDVEIKQCHCGMTSCATAIGLDYCDHVY